jgi:hypothetical protein
MTRFWPQGLAISVRADALATPQTFTWDRAAHQVERVLRRWRIDQRWWEGRVCREYFLLRTESGLLVTLYRNALTRDWYLQRVYD